MLYQFVVIYGRAFGRRTDRTDSVTEAICNRTNPKPGASSSISEAIYGKVANILAYYSGVLQAVRGTSNF